MKVLILGSGVIGVSTAYYLGRSPAMRSSSWIARRRRAGDQLRQCGRGLSRLFVALGGARHADQGG